MVEIIMGSFWYRVNYYGLPEFVSDFGRLLYKTFRCKSKCKYFEEEYKKNLRLVFQLRFARSEVQYVLSDIGLVKLIIKEPLIAKVKVTF